MLKILFIILLNLNFLPIFYSNTLANSSEIKEVNYFSSLRGEETNVRAGPGHQYPIKFIYIIKSAPIKVISEYDNWCEIEDYEKQTGWVSKTLLTKKRTIMVNSKKPKISMHRKNKDNSKIVELQNGLGNKLYIISNILDKFVVCSLLNGPIFFLTNCITSPSRKYGVSSLLGSLGF